MDIPVKQEKVRKITTFLEKMGLGKSRHQKKAQEKPFQVLGRILPEIPRDSSLGWMLEHWDENPRRVGKFKEKMIHFCMEKWGGREIGRYVVWPIFGTFETWTCESLFDHVAGRSPRDPEEIKYTDMWRHACSGLYPVRALRCVAKAGREWEPLENLPPPYLVSLQQPDPAQAQVALGMLPEAGASQVKATAPPSPPPDQAAASAFPHGHAVAAQLCLQASPKIEERKVDVSRDLSHPTC